MTLMNVTQPPVAGTGLFYMLARFDNLWRVHTSRQGNNVLSFSDKRARHGKQLVHIYFLPGPSGILSAVPAESSTSSPPLCTMLHSDYIRLLVPAILHRLPAPLSTWIHMLRTRLQFTTRTTTTTTTTTLLVNESDTWFEYRLTCSFSSAGH
ncbi:hypothetical protein BST61_g9348 [Cercospora zeina]